MVKPDHHGWSSFNVLNFFLGYVLLSLVRYAAHFISPELHVKSMPFMCHSIHETALVWVSGKKLQLNREFYYLACLTLSLYVSLCIITIISVNHHPFSFQEGNCTTIFHLKRP